MAVFENVDMSLADSLNEGVATRYTLTAEVENLTQKELTAKILSMLQSEAQSEEILKSIKAEIQKEEIPNIPTDPNEAIRRERDEKLNAWAHEIQEENLRQAYYAGVKNTIWEDILGYTLESPPSSDAEEADQEKGKEEADQKQEEELEQEVEIQDNTYNFALDGYDTIRLRLKGTTVFINDTPIDKDDILTILTPYRPAEWVLIGAGVLCTVFFALWLSLLNCGLERMSKF